MNQRKIRFGILGAGKIAEGLVRAMSVTDGEVYAIASRSLEKAEAFKQRYQLEQAYGSYEALVNDPKVDCVYIATPHSLHAEQMVLALNANKAVLCEKAFTLNASQAKAIAKLAHAKRRFVMEAMWTRFLPTIQALQKQVQSGVIGDVIKVDATLAFGHSYDPESRLYHPALGGGALLDLGVYTVTLANLFMGRPNDYLVRFNMDAYGVDQEESLVALYPDRGAFLFSSFKETRTNDAFVIGTKGWIKIEGFHRTEKAYIYRHDGTLIQEIHHPHQENGLEYEIQEVIQCLRQGKLESDVMPLKETISIMEQLDAIRKKMNLIYPQETKKSKGN
jgi:dihydrodiol dehydrogenase / D-xylose 1-dehydrogenase (NADP)